MKVTAIVTVSVKIVLPDNWNSECTIEQIFEQASASARNIISQRLATVHNVTVHKEAKVEAVLTEN